MEWSAPGYLWLTVAAVPLLAFPVRALKRRRLELARLRGEEADHPALAVLRRRGWASVLSLTVAVLLLVASLAGPRWGRVAEEWQARGADIVIALDTSRSMAADDLRPTRLVAAKDAVAALVAGLTGDRIGLLAFAGSAFVVCPLSLDYGAFGASLAEAGPDTIPLGGTSLAAALKEAGRAFPNGRTGGRVLILISDGEDQAGDYAAQAAELKKAGVTVYCVAAGTVRGGLIPLGHGEFFKDRRGSVVQSRLQPAALEAIASATGGRRIDLATGPTVLADLYRGELSKLERSEARSIRPRLQERFQIPLALALVLLALEPWWIGRVLPRREQP